MGDTIMKKLLSILFSVSLIFGMGTNAFAGEDKIVKEKQKAIELVNKTNEKIRKEIEKGVKKAEKLQADYYADVEKLQNKDKDLKNKIPVDSLQDQSNIEEIDEIFSIIEEEVSNVAKTGEINGELVVVNENTTTLISPEKFNCENFEGAIEKNGICRYQNGEPFNSNFKELDDKYTLELEKIINNVYYETLKMSTETISKVKEVGYIAECSWVQVEFGHLIVWIDPIRIVGEI
jgi:hypothetical protein